MERISLLTQRPRFIPMLTVVAVLMLGSGGTLVALSSATISAAATTTLHLTSSSPGVTCDNSNPSMPVCSGLAGGDTITLAGTGFTPGSLASDIECNSDMHQPVILFLGNYIPISCTPLKISNISSTGAYNPPPFAVVQGTTGPVLNNPSSFPPGAPSTRPRASRPCPARAGPFRDARRRATPPRTPPTSRARPPPPSRRPETTARLRSATRLVTAASVSCSSAPRRSRRPPRPAQVARRRLRGRHYDHRGHDHHHRGHDHHHRGHDHHHRGYHDHHRGYHDHHRGYDDDHRGHDHDD